MKYRVDTNSSSIPWKDVKTLADARKHADKLLHSKKCHTVFIDRILPTEKFIEKHHWSLDGKKILVAKSLTTYEFQRRNGIR